VFDSTGFVPEVCLYVFPFLSVFQFSALGHWSLCMLCSISSFAKAKSGLTTCARYELADDPAIDLEVLATLMSLIYAAGCIGYFLT
jgi:predicted permease